MIDHSQSFREKKVLRDEFLDGRVWLPLAVYERLKTLDQERVEDMMKGLLTRGQIKTLLVRRDRIIEKIDRDRAEYGDDGVFVDP